MINRLFCEIWISFIQHLLAVVPWASIEPHNYPLLALAYSYVSKISITVHVDDMLYEEYAFLRKI